MTTALRTRPLATPLPRSKKRDYMRTLTFPGCSPLEVHVERAGNVKVELRSNAGELIERLPVDAKELVATGEWRVVRLVA